MRIKLDWGQSKEPKKPVGQITPPGGSSGTDEPVEHLPDWKSISSKNIIGPPGHPRIRVKLTRLDACYGCTPRWMSYTVGGAGTQTVKVQYPKPTQISPRSIPLTEGQSQTLAQLLSACQASLPGVVPAGCSLDGERVEVSISSPGHSACFQWEGGAPWEWQNLERVVNFIKDLAGESDLG